MVNSLMQALKPMQIFCAISGFHYIRESKINSQSFKISNLLLNIIEFLRCCAIIYIYIINISEKNEIEEMLNRKTSFSTRAEQFTNIVDHVVVSVVL